MGMVEKLVMLSKPIFLTTRNKIMYIKWENKVNTVKYRHKSQEITGNFFDHFLNSQTRTLPVIMIKAKHK